MTQERAKVRNNLVIGFLAQHRGSSNSVSQKAIAEFLAEMGFRTNTDAVHDIVRKIIFRQKLLICSANGKGYYWGENESDIKASIDDFQGRINELQNRIDILKNFLSSERK